MAPIESASFVIIASTTSFRQLPDEHLQVFQTPSHKFHLVFPMKNSFSQFFGGVSNHLLDFLLWKQQTDSSSQQKSCGKLGNLLAALHRSSPCKDGLSFTPWLIDSSKGIPLTIVSWKQMSYFPPTCSLKIAPANSATQISSQLPPLIKWQ